MSLEKIGIKDDFTKGMTDWEERSANIKALDVLNSRGNDGDG